MRLVLDKIEEVKAGSPKLKEFAGDLADTIKSTYSRVKDEVKNSGAGGSFKQGFLGQFGINTETVTETEAKKKKAQGTEVVAGSTALEADKLSTPATPDSFSAQASAEKETEANEIRQTQLEKQTKTQEDITALYVISDDFFKATKEHQTKLIEKLEELIDTTEANGGGGGTGLGLDDLVGRRGGAGGAPKGAGGGKLAQAGKFVKGAAITAAVTAAGGYAVDAAAGALGVGKDKDGNDLKVDEKQDDANWNKMSTFDKVQSGAARGIEKVGSFFFMDNLAREAQATRIKKETEILNARNGTSSATGAPPPGSPPGTQPSGPSTASGSPPPAVASQEPDVQFGRRKLQREQVGGHSIAGYEAGYNLSGKKEDVDAAAVEYEKFDQAARAGDTVGMDTAAANFKRLAGNIQSPEYRAKMKEISDTQAARKKGGVEKPASAPAATAATAQAPTPKSSGSAPTSTAGVERPVASTASNTSGAFNAPKAASQTASAPAEKPVSAERMKRAEEAKQNALSDGASPQEADEIAAKMIKYGTVISAGQGRGSVYGQFKPTEDTAKPVKPTPAPAPTGGQLQQATAGVANAQSDTAAAGGGGATNIVAPSNSTVVNNNQSAPSSKDTRNTESTFQRYLDRRYYPTAAR